MSETELSWYHVLQRKIRWLLKYHISSYLSISVQKKKKKPQLIKGFHGDQWKVKFYILLCLKVEAFKSWSLIFSLCFCEIVFNEAYFKECCISGIGGLEFGWKSQVYADIRLLPSLEIDEKSKARAQFPPGDWGPGRCEQVLCWDSWEPEIQEVFVLIFSPNMYSTGYTFDGRIMMAPN